MYGKSLLFFFRSNNNDSPTTGILSNCDHAVAVTFHVIVPLDYWQWDQSSHIYLRFGHTKLGSWKHDIGNFEIHK